MTGTEHHTSPATLPPPSAPVQDGTTVRARAETARSALMEVFGAFKNVELAPRHKGLVRLLLEAAEEQIRYVEDGLTQAWQMEALSTALRGAAAAVSAGDTGALARLRHPITGRPAPSPSIEVANSQVEVLSGAIGATIKECASRLSRIDSLIRDTRAVLGDRVSTNEDLVALVQELQSKLAESNATWSAKLSELEARVDTALARAAAPRPPAKAPGKARGKAKS